jgi:hypothetical protein
MTPQNETTLESRRMTRSSARALASQTNSAADHTDIAQPSRRSSVWRVGVTFAQTNTLRRAASIISQDPTFSAGAQAAAESVLGGAPEGNARIEPQSKDWAPYIISDRDEGYLTGWWTSYLGLSSNLEAESTTPNEESIVPEGALRT